MPFLSLEAGAADRALGASEPSSTRKGHMLLYLGPETLIPVASVVAAIVGIALLFGRKLLDLSRRAYRALGNLVSALLSRLFPTR